MKELILSVLNSQYRDWIMFFIPIGLGLISTIYKFFKHRQNKNNNKLGM